MDEVVELKENVRCETPVEGTPTKSPDGEGTPFGDVIEADRDDVFPDDEKKAVAPQEGKETSTSLLVPKLEISVDNGSPEWESPRHEVRKERKRQKQRVTLEGFSGSESVPVSPVAKDSVKRALQSAPATPFMKNDFDSRPSSQERRERDILARAKETFGTVGDPTLEPGESLLEKNDVVYCLDPDGCTVGTLYVSNYYVFFRSSEHSSYDENWSKELKLNLGLIWKMEKIGHQSSRGSLVYGFGLWLKDFRAYRFMFQQVNHARRPCYEAIQAGAFGLMSTGEQEKVSPRQFDPRRFPAVVFREALMEIKKTRQEDVPEWAWAFRHQSRRWYDPVTEYARIGVSKKWRMTEGNINYELCESYPSLLWVPSAISDEVLGRVALFRSRGRIPVLSWISKEGVSITRCAQPLVGLKRNRSEDDELYFSEILKTREGTSTLWICDCRPKVNAVGNTLTGSGYEIISYYPGCSLSFMNIENIHAIRGSLRTIYDLALFTQEVSSRVIVPQDQQGENRENRYHRADLYEQMNATLQVVDKAWLSTIEKSRWLDHIKSILLAAVMAVRSIDVQKQHVTVHCSDGWDRTAQVTSLAMLCLDPFYRTLKGFAVLVEKEWCTFGHRFGTRLGHGIIGFFDGERSPVFLQFVECVRQIARQFPRSFEFNEHFLMCILDELFSCRYGNFFVDSERERKQSSMLPLMMLGFSLCVDLTKLTFSIWPYLLSKGSRITNAFYCRDEDVLYPVAQIRRLDLWNNYYFRYCPFMTEPTAVEDIAAAEIERLKQTVLDQQIQLDLVQSGIQHDKLFGQPESEIVPEPSSYEQADAPSSASAPGVDEETPRSEKKRRRRKKK